MAMLQINEEQLEEIIKQEVSRIVVQKENYINKCIVDSVINEVSKEKKVIHTKVEEYLDDCLSKDDSSIVGVIKNRIGKAIDVYLVDKRHAFNTKITDTIQQTVSTIVHSPSIGKGLIEPWLTKHVVECPEFIKYIQTKVESRLDNKITSLNNILGENITMPIVKEFLTDYLARRNMKGDIS